MRKVFESIVNSVFRTTQQDLIEGKSYKDFVGKVEEFEEGLGPVVGVYFVKDTELSEYPVMVVNYDLSDEIATFIFNQTYLQMPDGSVFTGDITNEQWGELVKVTSEYIAYEFFFNHYYYLEAMIDKFGPRVFGKPNHCHFNGGFIGAHGDKCYSGMNKAIEQGISKYHYAMMFLLTYTNLMDRDQVEAHEWITQNYLKYKDMLTETEREVFGEHLVFDL